MRSRIRCERLIFCSSRVWKSRTASIFWLVWSRSKSKDVSRASGGDAGGTAALGFIGACYLARQRTGFESGLEELDSTIASVKGKAVNQETVLAALNRFKDIYAKLPPYQRRDLIGLVLLKAEVTENQLRLSFHGRPAAPEVFEQISSPGARAPRRAEPFEWLCTQSAARTAFSVLRAEIQLVLSPELPLHE